MRRGVVVALAAAFLVVLAAATGGPAKLRTFSSRTETVASPPPPVAVTPPPLPDGTAEPSAFTWVATGIAVLFLIAGLVLVVLVVLRMLARRRDSRVPAVQPPMADTLADVIAQEADAPAVRRGIAAALAALEDPREPGDAVVRAWTGLQQSAEDAGVRPEPAETPTEFSVRVLSRTGADAVAIRGLLSLYLRARFGGAPVTRADAEAARTALLAVLTSWSAEPVAR